MQLMRCSAVAFVVLASCSQPAPSAPQSVDVAAQLAELRERLDDKDAQIAKLQQALKQSPQELTETQPYLVSLPHFPALGGVVRPQAQQWLATGDEICFDARQGSQWFSVLNRAMGVRR
jgi:hypothetical protein